MKDAIWVTYDVNSGPNSTLSKPIQEFDMSDLYNGKKKRSINDNDQVKIQLLCNSDFVIHKIYPLVILQDQNFHIAGSCKRARTRDF